MKKIYLIGMGNLLMGDDGFGIRIIEELSMKPLPGEAILIDGHYLGIASIPEIEKNTKIIFIDAVKSGLPPGSLSKYQYSDLAIDKIKPVSLDQLTIIDFIDFYEGKIDQSNIIIIGIEPKIITNRIGLSPEIEAKISDTVNMIINEIENYLNITKFKKNQ
ncbi:MAG: hydrogenase maturation protease [Patescibacteria group bacterium]|nr:hydrogenase maturation protease [Patescibacteria group bacterium]